MQSLSLLRLIEKFAEIHRQVSLRSLILIFLSLCDLGDEGVTMGLPPQTPLEGFHPSNSLLRFVPMIDYT